MWPQGKQAIHILVVLDCGGREAGATETRNFADLCGRHIPLIPGRPRQEDHEFEASTGCVVRLCFKTLNNWKVV